MNSTDAVQVFFEAQGRAERWVENMNLGNRLSELLLRGVKSASTNTELYREIQILRLAVADLNDLMRKR